MSEIHYTYNEIQREKANLLLKNLMFEMIEQKDYGWKEDSRKMTHDEIKAMIEDKLGCLEDSQFDVLIEKIVNAVFDTF